MSILEPPAIHPSVRAQGTTLTADAKNGTPLQIWECSASRPSQDWIWKDGHLKHVCSGLCVDVKDGQTGQTAQLWECFDGNKNQQFEIPADPWLPQGDPPRPSPTPI